eukprot:988964-Pleurochrysis_carterae.AAC.1
MQPLCTYLLGCDFASTPSRMAKAFLCCACSASEMFGEKSAIRMCSPYDQVSSSQCARKEPYVEWCIYLLWLSSYGSIAKPNSRVADAVFAHNWSEGLISGLAANLACACFFHMGLLSFNRQAIFPRFFFFISLPQSLFNHAFNINKAVIVDFTKSSEARLAEFAAVVSIRTLKTQQRANCSSAIFTTLFSQFPY